MMNRKTPCVIGILVKGSPPLAIEFFVDHAACRCGEHAPPSQAPLDKAATERKPVNIPGHRPRQGPVQRSRPVGRARHLPRKEGRQRPTTAVIERRGLTMKDARGRVLPLLPNSIWESDDMSSNEPFRFLSCWSGWSGTCGTPEPRPRSTCSAHAGWASMPLACQRHRAYRVEDIADHMCELVTAWGLPMVCGWSAACVELRIGCMALTGSNGQKWGGLGELFSIEHTWRTRGKGTVSLPSTCCKTSLPVVKPLVVCAASSKRALGTTSARSRDRPTASQGSGPCSNTPSAWPPLWIASTIGPRSASPMGKTWWSLPS